MKKRGESVSAADDADDKRPASVFKVPQFKQMMEDEDSIFFRTSGHNK